MEKGNFDGLVNQIESTTAILCEDAKSVINRSVTARAWLTGFYIVEYEQHGNDRAKYGEGLLKALAKRLDSDKFSYPSLKIYRQFYLAYPELSHPVAEYLIGRFGKGSTVSSLLTEASTSPMLLKGSTASSLSISPRNVEKCDEILKIDPVVLFTRLSFSHISELLHLSDDLQRTFYAIEAIRGTWSVRELRRQIDSQYYARSGWSNDPAKLSNLTLDKADKATLRETPRSPHVFEFLVLAAKDVWEESDLEQGIIDHLQSFILEMGLVHCCN